MGWDYVCVPCLFWLWIIRLRTWSGTRSICLTSVFAQPTTGQLEEQQQKEDTHNRMKVSWNARNHTNARFKRCWHRHTVIKDSFMLYKWPQTNTLSLIDSSINWLREGTLAPLQQIIFYSQPWQYNTDCTTLSTVLLLQKKETRVNFKQPSEGKCLTSKFSSAFAYLRSDSVWLLHHSCGCTSYSLPGSPSAAWTQRGTQTEGLVRTIKSGLFFPCLVC